jgi:hypothetical protein
VLGTTDSARGSADAPNPFIGLRPFDIDDADRFFGRNTQTYELLRRLHTLHFVAVLGPSGCGKSSLIRAGVLSALRNGYLTEDGDWSIAILEPGADPLRSWTRHLTPFLTPGRAPDDLLADPAAALDTTRGPLVVLVDQFEDLFRYGARLNKTAEVARFVHAMLSMGHDPRIYLMLTMRSEYLPQCANHAELAAAINEGLYLVPRMDREQMKQAIVGQVRAGGSAITTELVDKLLDDATTEDDSLPLLQHALTQIWPRRERWEPLGLELYPKSGGLATFVDQHAERVYASLGTDELKSAAEALFRAITEMTPDGRAARRPLPFDEVMKQTGHPPDGSRASFIARARLTKVIEAFRSEGFITVKEEASRTIDIAHEAVARQWKRLGQYYFVPAARKPRLENVQYRVDGWMIAEARKRRATTAVRDAAAAWIGNGKDKGYLFRGRKLRQLTGDLAGHAAFTTDEQEFLSSSQRNDRLERALSPQNLAKALGVVAIALAGFAAFMTYRAGQEADRANLVAAVDQATSLARTADVDKLKAETAYLQAKESAATSTTPPPPPGVTAPPTKARLYTQIWNEDQRRQVQPIVAKLPAADIDVARFETVTIGPNRDELRYFRSADLNEAQHVASLLNENGLKLRLSYVPGFENSPRIRPRHYELWLAAPQRPVAQAQPPTTAPPPAYPGRAPTDTPAPTPYPGGTPGTAPAAVPGDVEQTPRPQLRSPRIDSITATMTEPTVRERRHLSLRVIGQWLDTDAEVRIDDMLIPRAGVVVSVLAPSSGARFATDVNFTVRTGGTELGNPVPRTLTLRGSDGRSVSAPFTIGQTIESGKAYRR